MKGEEGDVRKQQSSSVSIIRKFLPGVIYIIIAWSFYYNSVINVILFIFYLVDRYAETCTVLQKDFNHCALNFCMFAWLQLLVMQGDLNSFEKVISINPDNKSVKALMNVVVQKQFLDKITLLHWNIVSKLSAKNSAGSLRFQYYTSYTIHFFPCYESVNMLLNSKWDMLLAGCISFLYCHFFPSPL